MKNVTRRLGLAVAVVGLVVGAEGQARAGQVLTFNATSTINGATASGPMSATIADTIANTVRVTLINGLTASDEFATTWGFGLNSTFTDYANINFTQISTSPKAGSPAGTPGPLFAKTTAIASANTGFNPSSIGDFNIRFDWLKNNHSFTAGTIVVYDLTYDGSQTFNASLFDATNHFDNKKKSSGENPLVYTAVKIQGIEGNDSGELGDTSHPTISDISAVPEPSTIALVCTAIPMGLGFAWKRRRKVVAP